jgi:hypothetical protein
LTYLNCGEDAEVVLGEVAQGVDVDLHGVLLLLLKVQGSEEVATMGGSSCSALVRATVESELGIRRGARNLLRVPQQGRRRGGTRTEPTDARTAWRCLGGGRERSGVSECVAFAFPIWAIGLNTHTTLLWWAFTG